MSKSKKGFELIWSTWVIMILAAVLLIFLILFFTMSSGSFMNNVKGYFSKTNVDSVVKGCNILVNSGDRYEFCCSKKDVKYLSNGDVKTGMFSCSELVNKSFVDNEITSDIKCDSLNCSGG
jgi:hypothetical protein